MKRKILDALRAERRAKRPVVLATYLASGEQLLVYPEAASGLPRGASAALVAAARTASRRGQSALFREPAEGAAEGPEHGREVFLQVWNPPLRLVVVGAVHIAQSLCPMARMAGFDVTVVDPRRAFATAERFPGVVLVTDWPDDALAALDLDRASAVVTLTHDPKIDEPALIRALASDAFYVGALGGRKTQAARLERLRAHGLADATLARIHGPVGLAIGARSTAEIAVSIIAEIVATLRAPGRARDA